VRYIPYFSDYNCLEHVISLMFSLLQQGLNQETYLREPWLPHQVFIQLLLPQLLLPQLHFHLNPLFEYIHLENDWLLISGH